MPAERTGRKPLETTRQARPGLPPARRRRYGLDQIARYLEHVRLREGCLVLFDLRKKRSWDERLFVRDANHAGKRVRIVGC